MVQEPEPPRRWAFLTNHAQVLICIADEPGVRLRDVSERVGITERAAHRIVTELADADYITRKRTGRRNAYLIHTDLPLPDALVRNQKVGDLLTILAHPSEPTPSVRESTTD
jgi:CTP-dependent riboflavin kinase